MRRQKSGNELVTKIRRVQKIHDDVGLKLEEIELLLARSGMNGTTPAQSGPVLIEPPWHLEMSFEADGGASVSVDNFVPFHLSRVLATLLYILAKDTGDASGKDDPLVPFKDFGAVTAHMAKMLGRDRYAEKTLMTAIHRLRKALEWNGFGGLIETDKHQRAYRLAIRRTRTSGPGMLSENGQAQASA